MKEKFALDPAGRSGYWVTLRWDRGSALGHAARSGWRGWAGAKGVLAQGLAGWPLASGQVVSPVKSRLAVSGVQRREFGGSAARNNATGLLEGSKDCDWKPTRTTVPATLQASG